MRWNSILLCGVMFFSCTGDSKSVMPMNEDEFWTIVDGADAAAGFDAERKKAHLSQQLGSMPPAKQQDFARWWQFKKSDAYREDLWAAAYVIRGGCSDDGFMDFRSALVGLGRARFESALLDPDSLAELAASTDPEDLLEYFCYESLSYAWVELLGGFDGLPASEVESPGTTSDLKGAAFEEDDLPTTHPRLWKLFGS